MSSDIAGGVAVATNPDEANRLLDHYYMMVMMRRFEEKAAEMYTKAKIGGYCHLNLGEEATVVGAISALESKDYIFTNYREHGYALARGISAARVMAELFGKITGVSKGRGGSMHLFDTQYRFLGGYGIVGGQIPLATGVGLAISYRNEDSVVLCQMGDGTTNIGAFHESLNIARIWNLPCVFFVVNNGYGMGTKTERSSAEPLLYKRGSAYNIPGERVDGNDLLAVRDAVRTAVERGRRGDGPSIVEAISYRFKGHSVVDPARYRDEAEVAAGRANDPITIFGNRLRAQGILDDEQAKEVEQRAEREVRDAVDYANSSPDPDLDTLHDYIYATPV